MPGIICTVAIGAAAGGAGMAIPRMASLPCVEADCALAVTADTSTAMLAAKIVVDFIRLFQRTASTLSIYG